jgi:hypothetical protein
MEIEKLIKLYEDDEISVSVFAKSAMMLAAQRFAEKEDRKAIDSILAIPVRYFKSDFESDLKADLEYKEITEGVLGTLIANGAISNGLFGGEA